MDFLSSPDWLQFQKSVGRKTWRLDGFLSANIVRHDVPLGKNYLYVPRGPIIADKSLPPDKILDLIPKLKSEIIKFGNEVKRIGGNERSMFVKVEPESDFMAKALVEEVGFRKSRKQIQPSKTVVVDLTKSQDDLWKALRHGAQYNIKFASKKGVTVKPASIDIFNSFWPMFTETERHDNFFLHEKAYYEKLLTFSTPNFFTRLMVAALNDKPIACAIFSFYKNAVASYLHSASLDEFRSLKPSFILNWEVMRDAKERGYTSYDLWGIDAKRMLGVTKFKLAFGGKVVEYPGSFDLPLSKFWYFWYKMFSKK
jgi:lipid II:glycine glycyltransferase (peptidoglycan interpeptide bridge formation enzyme)